MILSDREVQAAIQRGLIRLTSCPLPESDRWSPITLDLTLDAEILEWRSDEPIPTIVNPESTEFNLNSLLDQSTIRHDCSTGYILRPNAFVLGWTVEKLKLPFESKIAARVEGKSKLARLGMGIHLTAPIIHPGFGDQSDVRNVGSPICLEIKNNGQLSIQLTKGMAICQIVFEEVHGTPERGYQGQFQTQGPTTVQRNRNKSGKRK